MAHTKGNWKVGRPGTVVSDKMDELPIGKGYDDTDYYGGFLIAESIARNADAKLMAAAPDLLEACKAFAKLFRECDMRPEDECYELADIIDEAIKKATE